MLLPMLIKNRIFAVAALGLLVAGCAGQSSELPPDYGSVNAEKTLGLQDFEPGDEAMSCAAISDEMIQIDGQVAGYKGNIKANLKKNQIAGYVAGTLFLPAVLATENNSEDKDAIAELIARKDVLIGLNRVKNCASLGDFN